MRGIVMKRKKHIIMIMKAMITSMRNTIMRVKTTKDITDEAEMAAGHSDEIILAPEKAKAAGVESEIIQPKSFRQVITTSGQVQAAQGDESVVVANVAGVVSFRHPVTDGMSVSKGAPILNISAENMPDGDPVKRTRIAYETAKKI